MMTTLELISDETILNLNAPSANQNILLWPFHVLNIEIALKLTITCHGRLNSLVNTGRKKIRNKTCYFRLLDVNTF